MNTNKTVSVLDAVRAAVNARSRAVAAWKAAAAAADAAKPAVEKEFEEAAEDLNKARAKVAIIEKWLDDEEKRAPGAVVAKADAVVLGSAVAWRLEAGLRYSKAHERARLARSPAVGAAFAAWYRAEQHLNETFDAEIASYRTLKTAVETLIASNNPDVMRLARNTSPEVVKIIDDAREYKRLRDCDRDRWATWYPQAAVA
jgi:hypothetical protein